MRCIILIICLGFMGCGTASNSNATKEILNEKDQGLEIAFHFRDCD